MAFAAHQGRKAALEAELARILPLLVNEYGAEKVIVFGSLATGEVGEWSDLDLIVIKETKDRFFKRLRDITHLISPRLSADVLVYTPPEFYSMCRNRRFFQDEIIGKGKVLYNSGRIKPLKELVVKKAARP